VIYVSVEAAFPSFRSYTGIRLFSKELGEKNEVNWALDTYSTLPGVPFSGVFLQRSICLIV
jgi:hypothetical protein